MLLVKKKNLKVEIIEYNYSVSILRSFFFFLFCPSMSDVDLLRCITLIYLFSDVKKNAFVVLMKLFGLHINAVNGQCKCSPFRL